MILRIRADSIIPYVSLPSIYSSLCPVITVHYPLTGATYGPVCLAGAGGCCWSGVRGKYCWLAGAGDCCWSGMRRKYYWLAGGRWKQLAYNASVSAILERPHAHICNSSPTATTMMTDEE